MKKEIKHQNITAWPELGVNFWGINKNATSTIISHFSVLTKDIEEQNYDFELGQRAKLIAKANNRYIDSSVAFNNGLKNFSIVRNPHSRFLSCFKQFKYPQNEIHERSSKKAAFNKDWSADDFLENIERKFVFRNKPGNKHYWKQSWFLPLPKTIDYIIKLEKLNNEWPFEFDAPSFISNKSNFKQIIKYNKDLLENIYYEDFENFGY